MKPIILDFFNRIQYDKQLPVTFQQLPEIMTQFARTIPFENSAIMRKENTVITFQHIIEKIIYNNRGGLCYELNPLLYYILKQLSFDVQLIAGSVTGGNVLRTHIAIVLIHEKKKYLLDVGFGSHLALQPIPFTGEKVQSVPGTYRVRKINDVEYMLEKYEQEELTASYSFDLEPVVESYLDEVRLKIATNPNSHFTKGRLVTQITPTGHHTLAENSYTVVENGKRTKETIQPEQFNDISAKRFGLHLEKI